MSRGKERIKRLNTTCLRAYANTEHLEYLLKEAYYFDLLQDYTEARRLLTITTLDPSEQTENTRKNAQRYTENFDAVSAHIVEAGRLVEKARKELYEALEIVVKQEQQEVVKTFKETKVETY